MLVCELYNANEETTITCSTDQVKCCLILHVCEITQVSVKINNKQRWNALLFGIFSFTLKYCHFHKLSWLSCFQMVIIVC